MDGTNDTLRFDGAVRLLPLDLRRDIRALSFNERKATEEIHLRLGKRPTVVLEGRERPFSETTVTENHINVLMELIGASGHTVSEAVKNGYITTQSGYRVGLCGDCAVYEGKLLNFHIITSVNIRISRDIHGAAKDILPMILKDNNIMSTLIVSPPGGGKTTLLRDIVRELSRLGFRISVADERKEIKGRFDIGDTVDVLEGIEKAKAINMLLRSMSPQVIAVDEITEEKDVYAMKNAAYCGVSIIATAHCGCGRELYKRPLYKMLMDERVFERIVIIGKDRTYEVKKADELK